MSSLLLSDCSASIFLTPSQERTVHMVLSTSMNGKTEDDGNKKAASKKLWISIREILADNSAVENFIRNYGDTKDYTHVFVSKEILSIISPIFAKKFSEHDSALYSKPIILLDLDVADFMEFLMLIFPYGIEKEITDDNVHQILELSAQLDAHYILKKCDEFFYGKCFSIMGHGEIFKYLNSFVKYRLIDALIAIIPYAAKVDLAQLGSYRRNQPSISPDHYVWTAIYEAKSNNMIFRSPYHWPSSEALSSEVECTNHCKSGMRMRDNCNRCKRPFCRNCMYFGECPAIRSCPHIDGNLDCIRRYTFDVESTKTSCLGAQFIEDVNMSIIAMRSEERTACFELEDVPTNNECEENRNSTLVWASKDLLAVISPVFRAMFFDGFVESQHSRTGKPISLRDKNKDEFIEFLECIHPYRNQKKINDSNVRFILSLADEYRIDYLVEKCSNFLIWTMPKIYEKDSIFEYFTLFMKYRLTNAMKLLVYRLAVMDFESLAKLRVESGVRYSHPIWSLIYEAKASRTDKSREKFQKKITCKLNKDQRFSTMLQCPMCKNLVCDVCSYDKYLPRSQKCSNQSITCYCFSLFDFHDEFLVL